MKTILLPLSLLAAGCGGGMDKPPMDRPITQETALEADARLSGGTEGNLLTPPQTPRPVTVKPGAGDVDVEDADDAPRFDEGLTPPRPPMRRRQP